MASKLALEMYRRIIDSEPGGSETAWIAGVILDGPRAGKRLRNMVERLEAGQEFCSASFMMPYECFLIDGIHVVRDVLEAPVDCDLDDYRHQCEAQV